MATCRGTSVTINKCRWQRGWSLARMGRCLSKYTVHQIRKALHFLWSRSWSGVWEYQSRESSPQTSWRSRSLRIVKNIVPWLYWALITQQTANGLNEARQNFIMNHRHINLEIMPPKNPFHPGRRTLRLSTGRTLSSFHPGNCSPRGRSEATLSTKMSIMVTQGRPSRQGLSQSDRKARPEWQTGRILRNVPPFTKWGVSSAFMYREFVTLW